MNQSPPNVKKSNPWKTATVLLLVVIVGMGVAIGILWVGQVEQSEYAQVRVFADNLAFWQNPKMGNYTYVFYYKYVNNTGYDPTKPIQFYVYPDVYALPATAGQTYHEGGIEIKVSEVYDEYVLLLVKPDSSRA
jgi:hypothetical protein